MKNKKLFIGIVAVVAVVCLNLRHAWKNYGIAENRIMAGVMAGSTDQDSTCATKPAPQITVQDKKESEDEFEKLCDVATVLIYFEKKQWSNNCHSNNRFSNRRTYCKICR